jgi:selenobiotic family peptide radical SAM maturase
MDLGHAALFGLKCMVMDLMDPMDLKRHYPACLAQMGSEDFDRLLAALNPGTGWEQFPEEVARLGKELDLPGYIAELAQLERAKALAESMEPPGPANRLMVNPTLQLIPLNWQGLPAFLESKRDAPRPQESPAYGLVWQGSDRGLHAVEASHEDLLALKIVVEELDPKEVAGEAGASLAAVKSALGRAAEREVLLKPPSLIRRSEPRKSALHSDEFQRAEMFTLQWHITQACDLSCKHCYDRSQRQQVSLEQGLAVLDDLERFCQERGVRGQVSFSGGNPLLHPDFNVLYRAAAERGFVLGILGNPTPKDRMEEILAIVEPAFFQISLEGLAQQNDYIRGEGHFARSLDFLDILRQLDIYSMVMLTLGRHNLDQVLPLGRLLEGKADEFNYNRLALVGEGAALALPEKDDYRRFAEEYLEAAADSPVMCLKDNLLNLIRQEQGLPSFGGCTGYGCGAAFNFVSLLSDGEVHACRKFPSQIGNINDSSLGDIYDSPAAASYRAGPEECGECDLRAVCGGCLAVSHGLGVNELKDRDPFCWRD